MTLMKMVLKDSFHNFLKMSQIVSLVPVREQGIQFALYMLKLSNVEALAYTKKRQYS